MHAELLRSGQWVFRYEESGESRRLSAEAYFVKAGIAIAELDARLESVPGKGEMLLTQVEDGRTLDTLSPGAYEILMYIKGKPRKPQKFSVWKAKKDYRQKGYIFIP